MNTRDEVLTDAVLLVDDNPQEVQFLQDLIEGLGILVDTARTWMTALDLLRSKNYKAMFLDLHLGTSPDDGFILLDRMEREGLTVPTQIVSHSADFFGVADACMSYSFINTAPIPKQRIVLYRNALRNFIVGAPSRRSTLVPQGKDGIFVIHGRNHNQRDRIKSIIQDRLGLRPIILERQSTRGRTIIEHFENHASYAIYAIAIFTGDDIGYLVGDQSNQKHRARQNVVFETGFFFGKLERGRVMILLDPGIELPSNIQGIVYHRLDMTDDEIEREIMKELLDLGIRFELR